MIGLPACSEEFPGSGSTVHVVSFKRKQLPQAARSVEERYAAQAHIWSYAVGGDGGGSAGGIGGTAGRGGEGDANGEFGGMGSSGGGLGGGE